MCFYKTCGHVCACLCVSHAFLLVFLFVLFYSGLFLFPSLFSKEKMKEGMELDEWVCGKYLEINEVGKLL